MKYIIFLVLLFSVCFAQNLPHPVYFKVQYQNGLYPQKNDIAAKAYLNSNVDDFLNLSSGGCSYEPNHGVISFQAASFKNSWKAGDIFNVIVLDKKTNSKIEKSLKLTNKGYDFIEKPIILAGKKNKLESYEKINQKKQKLKITNNYLPELYFNKIPKNTLAKFLPKAKNIKNIPLIDEPENYIMGYEIISKSAQKDIKKIGLKVNRAAIEDVFYFNKIRFEKLNFKKNGQYIEVMLEKGLKKGKNVFVLGIGSFVLQAGESTDFYLYKTNNANSYALSWICKNENNIGAFLLKNKGKTVSKQIKLNGSKLKTKHWFKTSSGAKKNIDLYTVGYNNFEEKLATAKLFDFVGKELQILGVSELKFNESCDLFFEVATDCQATIEVTNSKGFVVSTAKINALKNAVNFYTFNAKKLKLEKGAYFFVVKALGKITSKKVSILETTWK